MPDILNKDIINECRELFSSSKDITSAFLFGSFIRGTTGKMSDLDIALVYKEHTLFNKDIFINELLLSHQLETILRKNNVLFNVDLVNLNKCGVVFQHNVIREGKVIYERDSDSRIRFVAGVISRFCDFKPTLDFIKKYHNTGRLTRIGMK